MSPEPGQIAAATVPSSSSSSSSSPSSSMSICSFDTCWGQKHSSRSHHQHQSDHGFASFVINIYVCVCMCLSPIIQKLPSTFIGRKRERERGDACHNVCGMQLLIRYITCCICCLFVGHRLSVLFSTHWTLPTETETAMATAANTVVDRLMSPMNDSRYAHTHAHARTQV